MNHRYDFIYLFDATDANPNGDPDAGNLPRVDTETGQGLVTDVMLKRKVRNFVALTKNIIPPHGIYVQEGAVLGRAHTEAFKKLKINLGEDSRAEITEPIHEELSAATLPEGIRLEENDDKFFLVIEGTADKAQIKTDLKESDLSKAAQTAIGKVLKGAKGRPPTRKETESGKAEMCETYFDIRTFGAVMSLKSAPNCGQVRGPVQISFARSVDPIVTSEHAITRCAVATEKESEKQSGGNRTMGRKFTVPYALYRAHGFINPFLADQTKFSEDADLELFFSALENAFQFDASAARPAGSMAPRALLVFRHDGTGADSEQKTQHAKLGCAPSHVLFERLKIKSFEQQPAEDGKPPRSFETYKARITFDEVPLDKFIPPPKDGKPSEQALANGITLIRRI